MIRPRELVRNETSGWRPELAWLVAELGALFVLFIVAFTGRDHFSDEIKSVLSVLSVVAGLIGVAGGLVVLGRGVMQRPTLKWRLPLGGLMIFFGGYTIVHILS